MPPRPLALQVEDGARLFHGRSPALIVDGIGACALQDDGLPPDAFASDGIWSGLISVDPALPLSLSLSAAHLPAPLPLPAPVTLDPAQPSLSLMLRYTGSALQRADGTGPGTHDPTPVQIISTEGALLRGALLLGAALIAGGAWRRWSIRRLIVPPAAAPLRIGDQVLPTRGLVCWRRPADRLAEDRQVLLTQLCAQGSVLLIGPGPDQPHLWRLRRPHADPATAEPEAVAAAQRQIGARAVLLLGACPRAQEIADAVAVPVVWLLPATDPPGPEPWPWPLP